MRVLDFRGLFIRVAGQNSKYTAANDTPYDGKAIGAFTGDAIRNMHGVFSILGRSNSLPYAQASGVFTYSTFNGEAPSIAPSSQTDTILSSGIGFSASNQVPTSYENTPAWISAYLCIKY
jgi:hypothetical protein